MASRSWGATGVAPDKPPRLSDDCAEQIRNILRENGVEKTNQDAFVAEIAASIGRYDRFRALRASSSPGVVRKNLDAAAKAGSGLTRALERLDGNSWQLIAEAASDDVKAMRERALRLVAAIDGARKSAEEYPLHGDLPDHARLFLAADVADAMKIILDRKPTSRRAGLFEALLDVVLEEATGRPVKAVHALIARVLSFPVKRRHPNGTIEYLPDDSSE